ASSIMAAMPDRQTPAQAGLFDAPPPSDAPSGAAADAGQAPAQAGTPPLPLPGFLEETAQRAPAAPPRAGKTRVPLWARLLGRPLHPWLKLDIETDPQIGD